jgi:hypothetical protein
MNGLHSSKAIKMAGRDQYLVALDVYKSEIGILNLLWHFLFFSKTCTS